MSNITDGFKDIFLAGVGAMALGVEKSKELVDSLIEKGEITVEQGKQINSELMHQVQENATGLRDDVIAAHMQSMSKEERDAFAAKIAEIAAQVDADSALKAEEVAEVTNAAEAANAVDVAKAAEATNTTNVADTKEGE